MLFLPSSEASPKNLLYCLYKNNFIYVFIFGVRGLRCRVGIPLSEQLRRAGTSVQLQRTGFSFQRRLFLGPGQGL